MIKKIFLIFCSIIVFVGKAQSNEKIDETVVIKGDKESLDLSDLNLSPYQYDDLSFFTKQYNPDKELLDLLDKPEVLLGIDSKTVALNFDDADMKNSER